MVPAIAVIEEPVESISRDRVQGLQEWVVAPAAAPVTESSAAAPATSASSSADGDDVTPVATESDAALLKDQRAMPSLEEAHTAKCVLDPAALSASGDEDVSPRDDMSTAASERERSENCILCSGSGLLCESIMSDPCPLCEPYGDTSGDQRPEALSATGISDGSSHATGPSDLERAEVVEGEEPSEQTDKDRLDAIGQLKDAKLTMHVVCKEGCTAMTAPPGLGPPGIWVWPYESKEGRAGSDASDADSKREEDDMINWPEESVDSAEVQFVGRVAQHCFGADFVKMAVSISETCVEGKLALLTANAQLHLEPTEPVHFLPPLARLQAVLARDQALHQCHIFRMDRAKDNASMHITCARVSTSTCWDILKNGHCPRPNCTWEHPAPAVMNITVVGGPCSFTMKSLADSAKDPLWTSMSENIQNKDCPPIESSFATMHQQSFGLNMDAFDEMTDSSDEM
jgi:hypothetical protein